MRYFKPLFVIILMIMGYRYENLFTIFLNLGFLNVCVCVCVFV